MKILVTGGAGFIGSHIVKTLDKQGHEVIVVDDLSSGKRENLPEHVNLIVGDVRDCEKLDLPEQIDHVFHLAAQMDVRHSVADPLFDASVNVLGTIAVLNYAVKAGAKKCVFSSTGGAIYGPSEQIPTPETEPSFSSCPYGVAKYASEQYVKLFSRMHNLPYTILRYSNVYGPGQDGSRESGVIAIFCKKANCKEPMTVFGDGEQTRDYVYVEDVVNANLRAMESEAQGEYNIATGVETSLNQLVDCLKNVVPHDIEVCYGEALPGEERRSCLHIEKARQELGWEPCVGLREGLERTFGSL